MIRKQFTISGKVQGVWFRASTREQALMLGISGCCQPGGCTGTR